MNALSYLNVASSYRVLKYDSFIRRMPVILILQNIKSQSTAMQFYLAFGLTTITSGNGSSENEMFNKDWL
jgi:hypothetical protein